MKLIRQPVELKELCKRQSMWFVVFILTLMSLNLVTGDTQASEAESVLATDKLDSDDETTPDITEENDVVILKESNFDSYISSNEAVLVEFYAPWCGHCKQLAPEYEKAAKLLKDNIPPLPIAKVDATVETNLASRYDVSGYPTLKFFKNGVATDYEAGRTADDIVNFVRERADPNWKPPPEAVIVLTKDNFTEVTNNEELMAVMFYAPWCGHCKRFAPEYEKAAKDLKNRPGAKPILLAKVDATVENELATQYGVTGYPTLKLFRKGRAFNFESDARDKWGVMSYMTSQEGPASKEIQSVQELKQHLSQADTDGVSVVAFFTAADDASYQVYDDAANTFRDKYKFVHTFDASVAGAHNVKPNSIASFISERFQTKHEPKFHLLQMKESTSLDDVTSFLDKHNVPLVGHYNSMTKDKRYKTKRPLVLMFYTVDWSFEHRTATQLWRKKFADIAVKYPEMTFAIADEDENRDLVQSCGLDESGEELNFAIVGNDEKYYPMDPIESFESSEIKSFLDSYKSGSLKPKLKSQPVPKKQPGPVTTVVGTTFEKIVLDKTKDVLIELYAPWCGHCKKLEPIYKELAKKLKNEPNLIIAKMDATANDTPSNYPVNGYPTIFFASSKQKQSPVTFSGGHTVESLEQFIRQHATVSLGSTAKQEL